jgi:enolase
MSRIQSVVAREVLDSRGRPTVEAEVHVEGGAVGVAIAPSGASTGTFEALELRDGDRKRFAGLGVLKAVENANTKIAVALRGLDVHDQSSVDRAMIALDGTDNKGRLGANAILAVSMAAAHAAAAGDHKPLYEHIAYLFRFVEHGLSDPRGTKGAPNFQPPDVWSLPLPMVNILSGGLHAGGNLEMQDFLAVPVGATTMRRAVEMIADVYRATAEELKTRGYETRLVADEGGFGPPLKSNDEALDVLTAAIGRAGYNPGTEIAIALDVAASHFFDKGQYKLHGKSLPAEGMIDLLAGWVKRAPVISIEDGLAEEDWAGWKALTKTLGGKVQLVGDDFFVTNPKRLARGIEEKCANAVLVKMNQIGTLTETLEVIAAARAAGYRTVVSARSGESEDTTMVHLAVGAAAGQIKIGSITRSERLAKYNEMMRIEDRLGKGCALWRWGG